MDYIVKPSQTRNVVLNGPTLENYSKVTFMYLKHPALHYFLVEIFTFFPNLQTLNVDVDGSAVLPQFGFSNAKNLEYFRVYKNTLDALDGFVFYGANKLKQIIVDSVLRIDENAFYGLTNLISLQISFSDVGLCSISHKAFDPLINLLNLDFFNIVIETIPASLFANNLQLESISILDDLRAVDPTFIDHLQNLKWISIAGPCGVAQWASPDPISEFHLAMAPCYANYTLM